MSETRLVFVHESLFGKAFMFPLGPQTAIGPNGITVCGGHVIDFIRTDQCGELLHLLHAQHARTEGAHWSAADRRVIWLGWE